MTYESRGRLTTSTVPCRADTWTSSIVSARRPAAVDSLPTCSRFMSARDMPVRPSEPTSRNVVEPAALAGGLSVSPAKASTRSILRVDHESSA